jgi:protoheme IX farnesyltransferase
MARSVLPRPPVTTYFRWLTLSAAVAALLLTLLNSISRADGAPGCTGYWPLCNGQWFASTEVTYTGLDWVDLARRAVSAVGAPLFIAAALAAWRSYARVRWVLWPAWLGVGGLLLQFLLGLLPPQPGVQVLHFALGLIQMALWITATAVAFQLHKDPRLGDALFHFDAVSRLAGSAVIAVFALATLGATVTAFGARFACPGWPLCGNALIPGDGFGWLSFTHRLAALTAGLLLAGSVIQAWQLRRENTPVVVSASLTAAFFVGQLLLSVENVLNGFPLRLNALHGATAALIWAGVVSFAVLAMQYVRLSPLKFPVPAWAAFPHTLRGAQFSLAGLRRTFVDYLILTKPVVMILLLVTTAAAMVIAGRDWPPLDLFLWTMLGGAMASGGASALNQVIDRDLDQHMTRTARRPIAQGRISYAAGLAFGLTLTVGAFYVLAVFVNYAAAFWAMAGSAYYVLGYSLLLKKSTVQNIVIGGGAGAIPPLVGWAAVSGDVGMAGLFLFALIFFWTPPHFWALSLLKKNDYARAGIPMLPVVWGEEETRRQILLYTLLLVALTLLFTPAGIAGQVYLGGAALLGLGFLWLALRLWRAPSNKAAWRLYKYSSYYLALMFALLVADRFFFFA